MPTRELQPYFKQLEQLRAGVADEAYSIVKTLQSEITSFITDLQLYDRGIDGKGKFLAHYAPYTIALKKLKGEVYTHTTLLDTGDFYEKFYAVGKYRMLFIGSRDIKTDDLVERYGPDIFTLTVEHEQTVNQELILPKLVEWFLNSIEI